MEIAISLVVLSFLSFFFPEAGMVRVPAVWELGRVRDVGIGRGAVAPFKSSSTQQTQRALTHTAFLRKARGRASLT